MRFRILMTLVGLFLLGRLTAAAIVSRTDTKGTYKALYDFASQATGEFDLQQGELVTLLQEDASGWWFVQKLDGSSEGWTPGSYLSKVPPSPSSPTRSVPLSKTTIKKSTKPKTLSSSAKKTSKRPLSTDLKLSSTSMRPSTSPSSSTFKRPSLTPSLPTSTSHPSSSSGHTPSLSTNVEPVLLSATSTHSSSPSPSFSSVHSFGQGVIAASSIPVNATFASSKVAPLSTISITAQTIASTDKPLNSSITLSVSVPATPSLLNPMNTSNTNMYKIVGSSSTSSTGPQSANSFSNNATECLLNCEATATPPMQTSPPEECLVNCDSANSSLVNATSQANSQNVSGAAVPPDCADPGGVNGVTTACWNALDMSQYVNKWLLSHLGMCDAGTSFAQCFLEVLDIGMNDCVSISSGTCPPPSWIQFKDHNMSVRDFYVAYNIYAVWTFFNSYYLAIGNARSAATDSVAAIVSLLNPPKTNDAELSNINFALLIGLTFVKIEGFASPVFEALVGFVVNAARQVPQVAKYLFPAPPGDTKFLQLGQISNQMGTLTDNLQKNVAIALSVVQNDTDTFLSFTGTGAFSNNPVVKLDEQSSNLLTALNTYVISLCLQANNWQISRAIDTDVNQLMANGTHLTWNITDCGIGYDPNSICGGYYWNKTIDVSYTLTNTDDMFRNPQPIMQQFFANWTTPQLLFDGALQCQMAKGTGNPNISPLAGATDVTSTPCLSSIKICTWDLNPSHFGTQYEYTDCDVQSNFATQGCSNCDATTDFCTNVPSTYLGGYLLNSMAEGPQYVYCDDGHSLINTN